MSISEEVRELPPSPLEIIGQFEQAHEELVKAADELLAAPSEFRVETLLASSHRLQYAVVPLVESHFFKESENGMVIDAGVGAFMLSGDDLVQRACQITHNRGTLISFPDEMRENLVHSLSTGDMDRFLVPGAADGEEQPSEEEITAGLASTIGNIYVKIVLQFTSVVKNTEAVQTMLETSFREWRVEADRVAAKKEKIKRAKLLGGVMAAAFAGSYLAHKFQKH